MNVTAAKSGKFLVELIKPSHYDDDGYVIQWWRAFIPSNSLSSVYSLTRDCARRQVLGEDTQFSIESYDETNTTVPIRKIIKRFRANNSRGLICMVGVQSNQFPRAMDIARQFRMHGLPVAIGGFHVSGCISMLPELPADLQEALDLGITLFAGESEGRLEDLYRAADEGSLEPLYNFMDDLPEMREQPTPYLPLEDIKRYGGSRSCFDAGRGCPFTCSFCTIINVQGRKSRYRDPDDIEFLIREHADDGVKRFFITDDNFARNRNWEPIFDRIIDLRENHDIKITFIIQVDTLCHKIPNFVEKAARAGCKQVFIGLENVNPVNLKAANKRQNRITEYRQMLQDWRNVGVLTYCGYILGFPDDTPESIERDIGILKRELPLDLIEFFILTPLPGSEDHQRLSREGVWMDPDMNIYDLEHVTTAHPRMSREELQAIYYRAWDLYYSPEHIKTLFRRAVVSPGKSVKLIPLILWFYGMMLREKVHPLQAGVWRKKDRTQRRSTLPKENPLVFYPKRVWQVLNTYIPLLLMLRNLRKVHDEVVADPATAHYMDVALTPVEGNDEDALELFTATEAARSSVAKTRATAKRISNAGLPEIEVVVSNSAAN
jgi:radical SAM superfamily enzyme YgiQ (UPF0313 family)